MYNHGHTIKAMEILMSKINIIALLFLMLSTLTESNCHCRIPICFTWKISQSQLTLHCKVGNLNFRVSFYNPSNKLVADCLPRPGEKPLCSVIDKNTFVQQNQETNETVFTTQELLNGEVNGNWTCRHGRRKHLATTEVTLFETKDNKDEKNKDEHCVKRTLFWTMIGFLLSILLFLVILSVKPIQRTILEDLITQSDNSVYVKLKDSKYFTISVCKKVTFAIVTVLFFSISAIISWQENGNCISQYILSIVAPVLGICCTIFCLNIESNRNENTNGIGENMEAKANSGTTCENENGGSDSHENDEMLNKSTNVKEENGGSDSHENDEMLNKSTNVEEENGGSDSHENDEMLNKSTNVKEGNQRKQEEQVFYDRLAADDKVKMG